jgi:glycosyltransferase involved in cell wall biosynthesis
VTETAQETALETGRGHDAITSAYPVDHTRRPARSLHVSIIAANTFEFDSRFLRSAQTLADDGHDVTVLALAGAGLPESEWLGSRVRLVRLVLDRRISSALRPLPLRLRELICRALGLDPDGESLPATAPVGLDRLRHPLRRLLEVVANIRRVGPWTDSVMRAAPRTDVFHCQTLVVLPVAHAAARRMGARFVYDVADYHVGTERLARMPWLVRELVRRRERSWARAASGFLAVSDPVADLVARSWGVDRPAVLLNCPPAWRPGEPGPPPSGPLREAVGVEGDRPLILYQGGFSEGRGLEVLIAALDEAELLELEAVAVFMGYGRLDDDLRALARQKPDRVYVLPAVPPDELLPWTAGADLAYVGQPAWLSNWRMNLPNKLFESLMAGVPVIVSKGGEQCRLVSSEGVGICSLIDPAAIARAASELLRRSPGERRRLRARCRDVALARYTWEGVAGGLADTYRRLATI